MKLYHYTCSHTAKAIIEDDNTLRPGPSGILWLTDLDTPFREALGLTSHLLDCDRTENRFEVDVQPDTPVMRWIDVHHEPVLLQLGSVLESTPGAMPMHWWISTEPLPAIASQK